MICKTCKAEGKKSTIHGGGSCFSTCMGVDSYYDEDGKHHFHDPNGRTYQYRCSNGHDWSQTDYDVCWCGYNKQRSDGDRGK